MKTPNTTEHDIRCKGTKSDEDLAMEWIAQNDIPIFSDICKRADGTFVACENQKSLEAIEKELGKERLEFLVFKIETEKTLAEHKYKIEDLMRNAGYKIWSSGEFARPVKQPWYKRLFS